MSLYEDPRAVDQLADEAVINDDQRKEALEFVVGSIQKIPCNCTRQALQGIICLLEHR